MKRQLKRRSQQMKKRRIHIVFILFFIPIFLFSYILIHQNQERNEHSKKREETSRIEHHNTIGNATPTSSIQSEPELPKARFSSITKEQRALKIPILMYHDVPDIPKSTDGNVMPKAQFEEQLKYLKTNGFTTITAQEFIDAYNGKINLPKKSVFITFDDGFQSIKTVINPLLKQYDMYATSFIIGSYIKRPQWHLTAEEIKTIALDKRIDFESHTYDLHKDGKAKGLINETAVNDIVNDNKQIESIIGHKANILCYPFGAFSNNAFEGLKAAQIPFGFAIASGSSTWVSLNDTHTTAKGEVQNPLALPRVRVNSNIAITEFAKLVTDN